MVLASDDSTPTSNTLRPKLTNQDMIHQIHTESIGLTRSQDETTEICHKTSVRLDNWSGNLESEISHGLW